MSPYRIDRLPVCLIGVLLLVGAAHAENADRNKPIHLESDQVFIDDLKQVSNFEGKVELDQGTLHILAEKIVVTQDKNGYKYCTATGTPASFRQKHEGTDEYMEGYGERIEYDTRNEQVDFFGQARVKRGQDDVQGDHISYSTRTEVFLVNGTPGNLASHNKGRVHAVIQPKSENDPAKNNTPLNIKPSTTLSNTKP